MVPFTLFIVGMQTSREQRDPARLETSASLHGDYLKSESAGSSQPWRRYLRGTFEFRRHSINIFLTVPLLCCELLQ